MKKIFWILILAMLVNAGNSSAQVLQKLSGFISSVDIQTREIHVEFKHPVTKEQILKSFQVVPSTNFKNVKQLDQIKPNTPVSIDYKENGGELEAVYVEVMNLSGLSFDPATVKKKFFAR